MSTVIPIVGNFARCIGWADPEHLEGLPVRDQLATATDWLKQGISARVRATPLDQITNELTCYRRLLAPPSHFTLTRDMVDAIRDDIGPEAAAALPPQGGLLTLYYLPPQDRDMEAVGVCANVLSHEFREDIRMVGGWRRARTARRLFALSIFLCDDDHLPTPTYTPDSVLRSVRSWPARIATKRESWFLDHALVTDDDRQSLALSRLMPGWLRKATNGRHVHRAEAPGPQVCRFWDYIDWPRLLREHPDQLTVNEENWPTSAPLQIVEDARSRGYEASLDVALWLNGFTRAGRPRFQLEAWSMTIDSSLPMDLADQYTDLIRDDYQRLELGSFVSYERSGLWVGELGTAEGPLSELIETREQSMDPRGCTDSHHWEFS